MGEGSWDGRVWSSPVAFRLAPALGEPARALAEKIAGELRGESGIVAVDVRGAGVLAVTVAAPGEIVPWVLGRPEAAVAPDRGPVWPDLPRTFENPGFLVRFAHVRASAVLRWARELRVPDAFTPGALADPREVRLLGMLAEFPSRARKPYTLRTYLERLADAYHEVHERVPALPLGDEEPSAAHASRVRLARAVRRVIGDGLALLGEPPPPERL
ncbi:DALR anticodon-binding domain-containing protein [Bailinhaonella thermotolerans]|uniref:DALR anticodon-binding domain-containing protein n=1 Tax=Bailinhaonella thermotolerans TaxID=1070861 RepID=UPI001F5B8CE5|nr:DALR anticodon-binding domain-containing protein [Bailinhaonella thermotolerans]